MCGRFDQNTWNYLVSKGLTRLFSIYVHCDLDLRPLTFKISHHKNICSKFTKDASSSLVSVMFTRLFSYETFLHCDLDFWPPKSIRILLSSQWKYWQRNKQRFFCRLQSIAAIQIPVPVFLEVTLSWSSHVAMFRRWNIMHFLGCCHFGLCIMFTRWRYNTCMGWWKQLCNHSIVTISPLQRVAWGRGGGVLKLSTVDIFSFYRISLWSGVAEVIDTNDGPGRQVYICWKGCKFSQAGNRLSGRDVGKI